MIRTISKTIELSAIAVLLAFAPSAVGDPLEFDLGDPSHFGKGDDDTAKGLYKTVQAAMDERDDAAQRAQKAGRKPQEDTEWKGLNEKVKRLNKPYSDYVANK